MLLVQQHFSMIQLSADASKLKWRMTCAHKTIIELLFIQVLLFTHRQIEKDKHFTAKIPKNFSKVKQS